MTYEELTGEVVAEYWLRDGQIVVEAPNRQSTAGDVTIRLIRKAVELAVAAEREACARLAEEHPRLACHSIAAEIRARGVR